MTAWWRVTLRTTSARRDGEQHWVDRTWDGEDLIELMGQAVRLAESRRAWWEVGRSLTFEYTFQPWEPPS